eukprot:m.390173 g.390173  ORF g.390173 m.390173 type:complete len:512 (-) comp20074_c8_seq3:123-1658(-)
MMRGSAAVFAATLVLLVATEHSAAFDRFIATTNRLRTVRRSHPMELLAEAGGDLRAVAKRTTVTTATTTTATNTASTATTSCPDADASGVRDSSAALTRCLSAALQAPGFVTVDLGGGVYRIDSPVVVNATGTGQPMQEGFGLSGGTLNASEVFPAGGFLLRIVLVKGVTIHDVVFESNHRGGCLRLDATKRTTVSSSFFQGFATRGIWATCPQNGPGDSPDEPTSCYTFKEQGDELLVQHSWFFEKTGASPEPSTGTAIEAEWSDCIFADNVLFCSKRGLVLGDGGNENLIIGNHFWVRCSPDHVAVPAVLASSGAARVFDCQFDRGNQVVVHNPAGLLVQGSTFHGGLSGVVLKADTDYHVLAHVIIKENLFHYHPPSTLPSGIWLNETAQAKFSRKFVNDSYVESNYFANASGTVGTTAAGMTQGYNTSTFVVDLSARLLVPEVPLTEVSYTLETSDSQPVQHWLASTSGGRVVVKTSKPLNHATVRVRIGQSTSPTNGAWCIGCPKE